MVGSQLGSGARCDGAGAGRAGGRAQIGRTASALRHRTGRDRDQMDLDGMLSVAERCEDAAFVFKVEVVEWDEKRQSVVSPGLEIAEAKHGFTRPSRQLFESGLVFGFIVAVMLTFSLDTC